MEQSTQKILEKHDGAKGGLISILEDIQNKWGYLPEEVLRQVAQETSFPLVDIYGVATFYKSFSLKPRGEHLISVCLGTACHVRGAPRIIEEFERQLDLGVGETTPDKKITLETVNCLGACALGPIVVVDGHYFSNVAQPTVKKIIEKTHAGLDKVEIKGDPCVFPVELACPRCNHSLMDPDHPIDNHPSIRVTVSFGRKHGWFRLSCLYGIFNVETEYKIPIETIMNIFCPYCHSELKSGSDCVDCGAPMIPMIVRGGGMFQACARRGCRVHKLDLDGVNF